jgi:REP element-mobilizing transposase RayT
MLDPEAIYHVVSRGNNRGWIVRDALDRHAFRERLDRVATDYEWEVYAWCLMTTHEHLLLRGPAGSISRGMQELNSRHARGMNRRHGRCGHLFENRFFSVRVATDAHFVAATAYVNRNPLAAFAVERAEDWRDSSYRATMGLDPAPRWLDIGFVLGVFGRDKHAARASLARYVRSGHVPSSEAIDEVRQFEASGFATAGEALPTGATSG